MTRKQKNPITASRLKDVIATYKANLSANMPKPASDPKVTSEPLEPAELDQDAGSGYNADFTFPQT